MIINVIKTEKWGMFGEIQIRFCELSWFWLLFPWATSLSSLYLPSQDTITHTCYRGWSDKSLSERSQARDLTRCSWPVLSSGSANLASFILITCFTWQYNLALMLEADKKHYYHLSMIQWTQLSLTWFEMTLLCPSFWDIKFSQLTLSFSKNIQNLI